MTPLAGPAHAASPVSPHLRPLGRDHSTVESVTLLGLLALGQVAFVAWLWAERDSEFFSAFELFEDAVVASTAAGALLGVLGVYVVLRRLVFLSAALSQIAGLGSMVALYLTSVTAGSVWALGPQAGALVATALLVLVIASERGRSTRLPRDSVLGLAYLIGAAGVLVVGAKVPGESQEIITSTLFGSAVAVLPADRDSLVQVAVVLLGLHAWWWRGFVAVSVDPEGARVRGLPTILLDVALWASLAVAVSATSRVLGALPTFAYSVLPAMVALRLAPNIALALVLAGALGAFGAFFGYYLAFVFELPVGATQAGLCATLVLLVETLRPVLAGLRGLLGRRISAERSSP
ncbi:MAG: metal ABC transporter permease [Myxococcales bacterium]|nr:metal ABC transporter permease [Myxococcales bacterium]